MSSAESKVQDLTAALETSVAKAKEERERDRIRRAQAALKQEIVDAGLCPLCGGPTHGSEQHE